MLTHSGLAEVRNEKYDIPTESYAQLNQLVRNMHGGSIGLAGPRGSGKTTLMHSISKIQELDKSNSRVLAVMTSAPVTYDTRDFIILIFKLLCTEYQSRIGEPEPGPYREMEQELKPSRSKLTGILWEILRPFHPKLRRYVLVLGIVLVALSFSLAVSKSAQSPAAAVTPAAPTATASGAQSAAPTGSSAAITMTLEEVGITAASLFRWGGILILATLAIGAIRVRLWKGESIEDRVTGLTMERPISHEELEREMRRWAAEEGIPWPEVQERLEAWYRKARITRRGVERRYDRFSSDPGVLARTWLRDLRFQQSYASGWSGSLHLPLGIETGVENTMQLAQYQLSLPEIIAGYQHFVKALRADYTVIIGIDELDKLGSAEEAYKFLNGIKALFGIDDCFYLISVSENAMSSFERRGLPIRDAFDSSFDKIVYVDYLDYAVAERLINRRVIGIPVPFIAFCYCMSGGLPRDLIRCCRLMFEKLAEKPKQTSPQKTPLNEIVNAIIETDLRLKLQAVAIAAKQSQAIDEVNKLLEGIYRFERLLLRSPQWPFESYNYFQNYTRNSVPANPNEKPDEEKRKILLLILELDTYLYYVATLHEYFSNLDIKRLQEDEKGELDTLARARQLFAYSIAESRRVIEEFRQSHNMDLRSVSGNGNRDASTGPRKKGKPEGT